MLSKRLISCLDVRDGKLAKSIKFVDNKDIGDPVEKAKQFSWGGVAEGYISCYERVLKKRGEG